MLLSVLNTIDVTKWWTVYLFLDNLDPGSTSFFQEYGRILQKDSLDGGLNGHTCACFGCGSRFSHLINWRIFTLLSVAVFRLICFHKFFLPLCPHCRHRDRPYQECIDGWSQAPFAHDWRTALKILCGRWWQWDAYHQRPWSSGYVLDCWGDPFQECITWVAWYICLSRILEASVHWGWILQ